MKTFSPILFAALGMAAVSQAQVILTDDFEFPDYNTFYFNLADYATNPDDESYVNFNEEVSGGNPGGYYLIEHYYELYLEGGEPPSGNRQTNLDTFLVNQASTYDPLTGGEVQSLSFSLDVRTSEAFDEMFFSVVQGGSGRNAGFVGIVSDGQWHTITVSGLTEADFNGIDFSGPAPLSFGFGFSSGWEVPGTDTYFSTMEVDNFMVTVTPVPEPSAALLGLVPAVLLLRRRR